MLLFELEIQVPVAVGLTHIMAGSVLESLEYKRPNVEEIVQEYYQLSKTRLLIEHICSILSLFQGFRTELAVVCVSLIAIGIGTVIYVSFLVLLLCLSSFFRSS